jgi:hypothetical protein
VIRSISSKVVEKLRDKYGAEKPFALSHDGWNDFYKKYREDTPIRYFLLETVPDKIDSAYRFLISDRIPNLRNVIAHRITERTHMIDTGLEVGYNEVDDRMFHGMFNLLKEFVEGELAWMEFICMDESHPLYDSYKKQRIISKHCDFLGIQSSKFRSPELGVMHITKNIDMNPYDASSISEQNSIIRQIEKYKEILELYVWYVDLRPNRKYISVEAFMSIEDREKYEKEYGFCFILSDRFKKDHPDVYREYSNKINSKHDSEQDFYEEDNKMLKKLVDIRSTLWT